MSKEEKIKCHWIRFKVLTTCEECYKGNFPFLNGSNYWHTYGECPDETCYIKFKAELSSI